MAKIADPLRVSEDPSVDHRHQRPYVSCLLILLVLEHFSRHQAGCISPDSASSLTINLNIGYGIFVPSVLLLQSFDFCHSLSDLLSVAFYLNVRIVCFNEMDATSDLLR